MSDVTLKNVNPLGAVQLPTLGLEVEAGAEFTVSAVVAGKAPTDKSPGSGLLAQAGNYELATPKKKD